MTKYGNGMSFLIGLIVGLVGNVVLALIVWLIAKEKFKTMYYWIGALIVIILIPIIFGMVLLGLVFGSMSVIAQAFM